MYDGIVVQVVDDHPVTAHGLAALLADEGLQFLGPVETIAEVAAESRPVVVCDLHLRSSSPSGPSAVRRLTDEMELGVVATTGVVGPTVVANSFGAGAATCLSKDGPFSAHVWMSAIRSAAHRQRYVTAFLAAALLRDARLRPLESQHDLSEAAIHYLHEVLQDADSKLTYGHRDPSNEAVAVMNGHVARVARRRWEQLGVHLSPRMRQAAELIRQGLTLKQVARDPRISIAPRTLDGELNDLSSDFQKRCGDVAGPLNSLRRSDLLVHLAEIEADENGWSLRYRDAE